MSINRGSVEMDDSHRPRRYDPQLRSSYRMEREVELRTLCDPAVRAFLSARQIRLINFGEAMDLLAGDLPAGATEEGVT